MRVAVHDQQVKFRVNEALLATAEQAARERGMSLSELVRQALRRELRANSIEEAEQIRIPLNAAVCGGRLSAYQALKAQERYARKLAEDGSYQGLSMLADCIHGLGMIHAEADHREYARHYLGQACEVLSRLVEHPDREDDAIWPVWLRTCQDALSRLPAAAVAA